ncbi:tRNA (adenine(22)-N(1))-methyltransferase [Bacillus testis]|uniref:tRNA (adenine(22)-N(1))-methyltransferase n=1 Tax=Bacillus testis TaxID=1622072 RepID=UPI00067F3292|nr:tRNA (adenine(22)-N(1))-methyltransferase TrmK [Bacillus testis]
MNSEHLSKRLHTVVSFIPKGSVVADIGSDHAYLPCYAVNKGIAKSAIAGEVSDGPFTSAQKQVKSEGLEKAISVRKGDGLEVLAYPGEATCITIAGMGGTLISSILEKGKAKLEGVETLVLQPNIQANNIREWLLQNEWQLTQEEILEEDGKIYEVLVAKRGNPEEPYSAAREMDILFGPFLMKQRNDVFRKKWTHERKHWLQIIEQLNKSGNQESLQKKEQLERYIQYAEEVLR